MKIKQKDAYVPTCSHLSCDNSLLKPLPTGACICPVCKCVYRLVLVKFEPVCYAKHYPKKQLQNIVSQEKVYKKRKVKRKA